uniref:Uncharacterized protein n=1 Tax=Solanum tuberosum TaxID=4113 RepID=M1DEU8_SOLTU
MPTTLGDDEVVRQKIQWKRVEEACEGRSEVLMASRRLPSETTDVSAESYRYLSPMDMNEERYKIIRRTSKSFGEHDPARRIIHRAYFSTHFLELTIQALKMKSKHADTKFTQDPYFPSFRNTQTSSDPAKF